MKLTKSQRDMNKGNAKLKSKERVLPVRYSDESKVRTVRLDSKTTVLLYPNDARYNKPIEVLRSEWEKKQEMGLKMLKAA